jgi:hypothetical protein
MAALREGTARRMIDQDWTPLIIPVAPNGARRALPAGAETRR